MSKEPQHDRPWANPTPPTWNFTREEKEEVAHRWETATMRCAATAPALSTFMCSPPPLWGSCSLHNVVAAQWSAARGMGLDVSVGAQALLKWP